MSLLQGVIGEFEYKEIEEVNHITAPIFLVVFVFFMFFILMVGLNKSPRKIS